MLLGCLGGQFRVNGEGRGWSDRSEFPEAHGTLGAEVSHCSTILNTPYSTHHTQQSRCTCWRAGFSDWV